MGQGTDSLLTEGIAAAKAGRREYARDLLMRVVTQDKKNAVAWMWLSGVVDRLEERELCMQNVLAIDPDNVIAHRGLVSVRQQIAKRGTPPRSGEIESTPLSPISSQAPSTEQKPVPSSAAHNRIMEAPTKAVQSATPEPQAVKRDQVSGPAAHRSSLPTNSEPRDPDQIFGMVFAISTVGAGIMMGLNWKRLGRPKWVLKTVLLSFAIPAVSISIAFAWLFGLMETSSAPFWVLMIVPLVALGTNMGYVWALSRLQKAGYKKWASDGVEAMLAHEYDIAGALTFGAIVAVATTVIGGIVIALLDMNGAFPQTSIQE